MNFNDYNLACFITSIVMLLLLIPLFNKVEFFIILIMGALFSITWRGFKLMNGEKIENGYMLNPLFILDFVFASLAFISIFNNKYIDKKFVILTFIIFVIAWTLEFLNYKNESRVIHLFGHISIIIVFIFSYYILISN